MTVPDWLTATPSLAALETEDRAWATNFLRHASGDWGNNQRPGDLHNDLARCRRFRPHAAAWLILHSTVAARIAAQAGWNDTHTTKRQPTADEIAHVEATLAALHAQLPIRSPADQLHALSTTPLRAYPLSPTTLDQLNPLPNGRKRAP